MLPRFVWILCLILLPLGSRILRAAASLRVTVTPAATGDQLVRTSLPFPPGFVATNVSLRVRPLDGSARDAALRALSHHPATSNHPVTLRRGVITFPYRFADLNPVTFTVEPTRKSPTRQRPLPVQYTPQADGLVLRWNDGSTARLQLVAPHASTSAAPRVEIVEDNAFVRWHRLHFPDPDWPRVLEVRLDTLGTAVVVGHLQNATGQTHFAPDFGWDALLTGTPLPPNRQPHAFTNGVDTTVKLEPRRGIHHPLAALQRRGGITLASDDTGNLRYQFRRSLATENVPMQRMSWRRAEIVFHSPGTAPLTHTLSSPHSVEVHSSLWAELYRMPDLLRHAPDEPELRPTIHAVADFLAASVDPAGGWRYPHPRSTDCLVSQGIEHAWQLTQAARVLGPEPRWLDAIETVLRARIHVWKRTQRLFSGLGPWELASGTVKDRKEIAALYQRPTDRNPARDYTEGQIGLGSAPPEGIVYFGDVLAFYLQHRPAQRLLSEPNPHEPLGQILSRLPRRR